MRNFLICPIIGAFLIQSAAFLEARELDGAHAAFTGPCPTVEEAISKMVVPDGYEVRCFASEPMVVNPVAMTWDARGRLWVVELYEYPSGAAKPNAYSRTARDEDFRPVIPQGADSPRDRVIILEDTDNDGKADKRTVFAEGLNLATAILCGHGGVYIGQAPNLFFFRDNNGDDKADEYKAVLTGFGLEDRHELLNSFTWGPDGWMYMTHGVFTHSKVRRPGQKESEGFTLNAGILRVKLSADEAGDPSAEGLEVFADGTSNPWGVDFDARGNAFVEACVIDHFFHMAAGGLYSRQGGSPENPYAYELLPSIVPDDHPGHHRAAYAGITVYHGGMFPEDTHGRAFFGNIHDNAIHEEAMDSVGSTFKARPIRDFLRANDGWFRPVSIQTGPDGFLWVMDWCDKYPCYQNALANPEGVDREKGRIWRVCHTGTVDGKKLAGQSRPSQVLDTERLSAEELLTLTNHPNNWMSRMGAIGLMHASRIPDSKLRGMLSGQGGGRPTAERLAILDALVFRQADPEFLIQKWSEFAADPDPAIRLRAAKALPMAGGNPQACVAALAQLAMDPDAQVRHAVAVAARKLGRGQFLTINRDASSPADIEPLLRPLIKASADPGERTLPFAIWMAMEPELAHAPEVWLRVLSEVAPDSKPLTVKLVQKAARRILDTRKPENVDLLLDFLDRISGHDDLTAAALEGMLKAQEAGAVKPATKDPAPYFVRWSGSGSGDVKNRANRLATLWGDPAAVASVIAGAADETTPLARRIELLETLRKLRTPATRQAILNLLKAGGTPDWLIPVLRAAAEVGSGEEFSTPVMKLWETGSPAIRTAAAQFLTSRTEWQNRLLSAIEKPDAATGVQITAQSLPATARRLFATHENPEIRARATAVLGRWSDSTEETKALIAAKRKASIEGEPDLALGKVLFTSLCAGCHQFHGGGHDAGPELIGSGRSNLDAILANVIDPNQIIGNGYQNFNITTKDGRILVGRIVEDTPTQVTLLGAGGSREVVPTAEIVKREDTGSSLMPMGFGDLPDDQFRSLIWYILAPPEEGPLTPAKKEALIKGAEAAETPVSTANPAPDYPRIDWESVSLWNPDWKVTAPEFEGSPRKLTDFAGRKNVLQLHPFPDRKTPATLTRKFTVPNEGKPQLRFDATAKPGHDWDLVIRINGKEALRKSIDGAGNVWKRQQVDLAPWAGKEVEFQLENHASGWSWEFSYWSNLEVVP